MRFLSLFLLWFLLYWCLTPVFSIFVILPAALAFGDGLISNIAFWATYPIAALTAAWLVKYLSRNLSKAEMAKRKVRSSDS